MRIFFDKKLISNVQAIIFVAYSIYAFFFAENIDSRGNLILLGLSLISLFSLAHIDLPGALIRASILNICIFFSLCIIPGVFFSAWNSTNIDLVFSSFCKCILGLSIVMIFTTSHSSTINRWIFFWIFIILSFLIIFQNTGFYLKENLNIFIFRSVISDWNEKYHTFWLVIFFWPIMYFIKDAFGFKIVITLIVTTLAVISSYSDSAKLAILTSSIVFITCRYNPSKFWRIIYFALILYIVTFPFIFQLKILSEIDWLYSRLNSRIIIFITASNAIFENFWFGQGFGSVLSLDILPFIPNSELGGPTFPGGHPHNLIALIWLEFGFLGATLFLFYLYKINLFIKPVIENHDSAPFIISLITTGTILFSFSWSIWQTDVVLTYIMFFSCFCLLISNKKSTQEV